MLSLLTIISTCIREHYNNHYNLLENYTFFYDSEWKWWQIFGRDSLDYYELFL